MAWEIVYNKQKGKYLSKVHHLTNREKAIHLLNYMILDRGIMDARLRKEKRTK